MQTKPEMLPVDCGEPATVLKLILLRIAGAIINLQ